MAHVGTKFVDIIEISEDSDADAISSPPIRDRPKPQSSSRYEPVSIAGRKRSSSAEDEDRASSRPRSERSFASSSTMDGDVYDNLSHAPPKSHNHMADQTRRETDPMFDRKTTRISQPPRIEASISQHARPGVEDHNLHIFVVIPPAQHSRPPYSYTLSQTHAAKPRPTRKRIASRPDLFVVNDVDAATLPTNFTFVNEYVFVGGTSRIPVEARSGCRCPPDNGRHIGCEYIQRCDCLEDFVDDSYKRLGFPYFAVGARRGCLRDKFLEIGNVIYECSALCACSSICRNKLVQHGRTLDLEIFRTTNRGWGLRSPQDIQKGQFIDTYRGEVITCQEADRREETESKTKDSYLFSLDKFADQFPEDEQDSLYVVDGEFLGGPTRFINHSCEPNSAIFCVSTTRGDARVYDLAFFALEDIPAGSELTFDYLAGSAAEDASSSDTRKVKAMEAEKGKLATKCLCGSQRCRGYLWL